MTVERINGTNLFKGETIENIELVYSTHNTYQNCMINEFKIDIKQGFITFDNCKIERLIIGEGGALISLTDCVVASLESSLKEFYGDIEIIDSSITFKGGWNIPFESF
jgi:hypothetical protein